MISREWFDDIPNLKNHLCRRGDYAANVDKAMESLVKVRNLKTEAQTLQEKRNKLSGLFGSRKKAGLSTEELAQELKLIKANLSQVEEELRLINAEFFDLWATLPNIPWGNVPHGSDESDNCVLITRGGMLPTEPIRDHVSLGESMGLMSFERAAEMSGSRFVILSGALAKLERAITSLMMNNAEREGYVEHSVPHLVKREALFGTGQLPKFEDDLFISGDHFLIPTAEVPLTNLIRNTLAMGIDNPKRFFAVTPCYRKEAGSAGRDTKGLMRMHQFNKVELVSICEYWEWTKEFNHMVNTATRVLEELELPYRTVQLCTGDLGFSAAATTDIEVWVPSEDRYREISSVSWCSDFQARRMDARYRDEWDRATYYQTLNGSGLAVGRTLLAVMEAYQQSDGGIAIPLALRPFMGGTFITNEGEIV